jgi:hypothetical protein
MDKAKPHKHNALVLEASALLATLKEFNGHMQPFENLAGIFDKVLIPDMVFYELTAILPSSQAHMQQQFKDALASSHPQEALDEVIDSYIFASPRTGDMRNRGEIAKELHALFNYVAKHPQSLVSTKIGQSFANGIMADHLVMMGKNLPPQSEALEHYRPSRRDVMDTLGPRFNPDPLRVHVGELYQMGLIDETEFNNRMNKNETANAFKRRFITLKDFVAMGRKKGFITAEVGDAMLESFDAENPYLTVKHFKDYESIMPHRPDGNHHCIDDAAITSIMNMEQYLYSGLIPLEEMLPIANKFGYHVDVEEINERNKRHAITSLHAQGFFEQTLTIGDIRNLLEDYKGDKRFANLQKITDLPSIIRAQSERFDQQCHNPRPAVETPAGETEYLRSSQVGLTYEKSYTDALVSRRVSFKEFFTIARDSGALVHGGNNTFYTRRQDIIISYNDKEPDKSIIRIRQKGFHARTGYTRIGYAGNKGIDFSIPGGKTEKFWAFTAEELIAHAREGMASPQEKNIYNRAMDTLLYQSAERSASTLHDTALAVIGPQRLLQIEKDASNRHHRYWRKQENQPAFGSTMATMHLRRRIRAKHLGELASLEAAFNVNKELPDCASWIANHDNSLSTAADGHIVIAPEIVRQRTEHKPLVDNMIAQLAGEDAPAIQLVPTFQLLNSLAEREHMHPQFQRGPKGYGGQSGEWTNFVRARTQEAPDQRIILG